MLGSKVTQLQNEALLWDCHSTWSPHMKAHSFTQKKKKLVRKGWAWLSARMAASCAWGLRVHSQYHRGEGGKGKEPQGQWCISRGSRLSFGGHIDSLVSFSLSVCLSIHLSACLPVSFCMSVCLSHLNLTQFKHRHPMKLAMDQEGCF